MARTSTIAILTAGLCALAVGACTRAMETVPLYPGAMGFGLTCETPFGAYYLPKTLLKLNAAVDPTNGKSIVPTLGPHVKTADRSQPLCLDYLGSLASDDIIRVRRWPNGLLEAVTSRLVDRTPDIADKLVEAGANLAIAAGRGALLQKGDSIDVEFDPFYWPDVMTVKPALRRFGICVYVEGYSFPIAGLGPAAVRVAAERWCSTDRPHRYEDRAAYFASLPVPPEVMNSGILYRPNVTHTVVVMQKKDPDGPEAWTLFKTEKVDMPNVGPILSVGIERAAFATRETDLSFNRGVLTDVQINKTAELVGFVRIPLAVAKAIVSVPAQILQIRIADTTNQVALLNAQGQLANTLATIKNDNAVAAAAAAPTSRAGAFVGSCTNAGGTVEDCERLARTQQ